MFRQSRRTALTAAFAVALCAGVAFAKPLPLRPVLTLEAARPC